MTIQTLNCHSFVHRSEGYVNRYFAFIWYNTIKGVIDISDEYYKTGK